MTIFNVISMFGGLALFLYGMRLMGDGLKHSSADTLKKAMEKVTNNPVKGFLLGLRVTAIIQSSKATIVLTSGLVGAGIISLHQSLGIILGANVGTTVTGQIIRLLDVNASGASWLNLFKPDTLAPLAAIIGILLIMTFKFRNSDVLGDIAMGFGILFTGLLNMTAAVAPIAESDIFLKIIPEFSRHPVLGFLVGGGVASLIQSSSATVGILQAFSTTGALTFSSIYAFIIGVNMCESVTTAVVCSIGAKADAKRTGMTHVIFNFFSMILVIIAITSLRSMGFLDGIWDKVMNSGGIANVNTLFRLCCAVVLLPFVNTFEKMSCKIIKDDKVVGQSVDAELTRMNEKLYSSPAMALESAAGAISAMANLAKDNIAAAMKCFAGYDHKAIDEIKENENRIDALADKVDTYLIGLAPYTPKGKMYDRLSYFTRCYSELERIGDHAVNLTETAADLHRNRGGFSAMAKEELTVITEAVDSILNYAYKAVTQLDMDAARRIEPLEEVVDDMVATLRQKHIRRLHAGICSTTSGLSFLDILSNLERVSDQCSNIGLFTLSLENPAELSSHHDYVRYLHSGQDEFFNEAYSAKRRYYFGKLEAIKE